MSGKRKRHGDTTGGESMKKKKKVEANKENQAMEDIIMPVVGDHTSADAQQTAVQGMDVDDGGLADDTTDNAVEEGSVALASGNGLNTAAWNCNAVLTERLVKLITYKDPITAVYAVGCAPLNAAYGEGKLSNYVCQANLSKAINYWITGRIDYMYFNREARSVSISIAPLVEADMHAAQAMYRRYSSATGGNTKYETIRVSAWQGTAGTTQFDAFTAFYDATERLQSKSAMPKLDSFAFEIGDIVLVEATLKKWAPRGRLDAFRASFDLISVCLLRSATNAEKADIDAAKLAAKAEMSEGAGDVMI